MRCRWQEISSIWNSWMSHWIERRVTRFYTYVTRYNNNRWLFHIQHLLVMMFIGNKAIPMCFTFSRLPFGVFMSSDNIFALNCSFISTKYTPKHFPLTISIAFRNFLVFFSIFLLSPFVRSLVFSEDSSSSPPCSSSSFFYLSKQRLCFRFCVTLVTYYSLLPSIGTLSIATNPFDFHISRKCWIITNIFTFLFDFQRFFHIWFTALHFCVSFVGVQVFHVWTWHPRKCVHPMDSKVSFLQRFASFGYAFDSF